MATSTVQSSIGLNLFDLDLIDIKFFQSRSAMSGGLRFFSDANHFIDITGTGLVVDASGNLTAGTITDLSWHASGSQDFTVTGCSASATSFWGFVTTDDT